MEPRIFIGSSAEAIGLALKVATAIENAGMTPVVWDAGTFRAGSTLLERIESFAEEFEGAILLFTPDVHSVRSGRTFDEPVANVMFEYGYLSARLSRGRVVICQFEDADLPSDLRSVKVIDAGSIGYRRLEQREADYETPDLSVRLDRELKLWLEGLPRLATCIPPMIQLHGYSGIWRIDTQFEVWRGMPVVAPDEVFSFGFTSLFIPPGGRGGKGTMYGSTHLRWADYRSQWDWVNEVREATVNRHGVLTLRVLGVRRQVVEEHGTLPDERMNRALPSKEWEAILEPTSDGLRELQGGHRFTRGTEVYQAAIEQYVHVD
jgi:Predicted nucleotide-binding protein containing TIR-like domain